MQPCRRGLVGSESVGGGLPDSGLETGVAGGRPSAVARSWVELATVALSKPLHVSSACGSLPSVPGGRARTAGHKNCISWSASSSDACSGVVS